MKPTYTQKSCCLAHLLEWYKLEGVCSPAQVGGRFSP
jgi:hypothetical protein